MLGDRYFGEYPPPSYPLPAAAPRGMGVQSFVLMPEGLQSGAFGVECVFSMLDDRDAALVLDLRAFVADWVDQERAMNAPFLDMARAKWS